MVCFDNHCKLQRLVQSHPFVFFTFCYCITLHNLGFVSGHRLSKGEVSHLLAIKPFSLVYNLCPFICIQEEDLVALGKRWIGKDGRLLESSDERCIANKDNIENDKDDATPAAKREKISVESTFPSTRPSCLQICCRHSDIVDITSCQSCPRRPPRAAPRAPARRARPAPCAPPPVAAPSTAPCARAGSGSVRA